MIDRINTGNSHPVGLAQSTNYPKASKNTNLLNDTALHAAVRGSSYNAALRAINCQPSLVDAQNRLGDTPLHIAASRNDLMMVNILLASGANRYIENSRESIPLELVPSVEGVNRVVLALIKR